MKRMIEIDEQVLERVERWLNYTFGMLLSALCWVILLGLVRWAFG